MKNLNKLFPFAIMIIFVGLVSCGDEKNELQQQVFDGGEIGAFAIEF